MWDLLPNSYSVFIKNPTVPVGYQKAGNWGFLATLFKPLPRCQTARYLLHILKILLCDLNIIYKKCVTCVIALTRR